MVRINHNPPGQELNPLMIKVWGFFIFGIFAILIFGEKYKIMITKNQFEQQSKSSPTNKKQIPPTIEEEHHVGTEAPDVGELFQKLEMFWRLSFENCVKRKIKNLDSN